MHTVITGANRGIGLALCHHYRTLGHHVTALCRQTSAALSATGATVIEGIDVADTASLSTLAQHFDDKSIDLLINNAGILRTETLKAMDFDSVQAQFTINAVAPLAITHALLNQLAPHAKVALITSRMGSIGDNGSGGYYGYRMSKAALNAAGKSLALDLKPKGISLAILHPGFVQTDMVGHAGDISAAEAASRLAARIEALNLQNSGSFWHSNGQLLPW